MPTTLHPTIRHRVINDCFQRKGKVWPWEELSAKCGDKLRELFGMRMNDPSRRTIMGDIEMMRTGKLGYNAPIIYDKIKKGFYYSDPNFSIIQSRLSSEDWKLILQAANILKQYRGFNQLLGVEEVVQRIELEWAGQAQETAPIIQFDHPLNDLGHHWLESLVPFIKNQQSIKITYQAFHKSATKESTFSPYLLKEYNKRWFLIGWHHEKQRLEVRPLDRIKGLSLSSAKYNNTIPFDPDTYFNQIIGVTLPAKSKVQRIKIFAIPSQANYIKTKKIHSSQKILEESATGTVFGYELILNFELESLLLSFGERIKILKPLSLRNSIARRLKEGVKLYEEME